MEVIYEHPLLTTYFAILICLVGRSIRGLGWPNSVKAFFTVPPRKLSADIAGDGDTAGVLRSEMRLAASNAGDILQGVGTMRIARPKGKAS